MLGLRFASYFLFEARLWGLASTMPAFMPFTKVISSSQQCPSDYTYVEDKSQVQNSTILS